MTAGEQPGRFSLELKPQTPPVIHLEKMMEPGAAGIVFGEDLQSAVGLLQRVCPARPCPLSAGAVVTTASALISATTKASAS
jgi:hypothetical protein